MTSQQAHYALHMLEIYPLFNRAAQGCADWRREGGVAYPQYFQIFKKVDQKLGRQQEGWPQCFL